MYIVRIELHREANYNPLHAAMARVGLKRSILGNDGKLYKLPTGTYYSGGGGDANHVNNLARAAAQSVGHHMPEIIVADSHSISFSGLDLVTEFERRYAVGV